MGQVAKLPPAPVPPPPPPPPSEEILKNLRSNYDIPQAPKIRSYEIPQAPKLKPSIQAKKGLVAPNGMSAREELMNAIRGTGGFQGLRKV